MGAPAKHPGLGLLRPTVVNTKDPYPAFRPLPHELAFCVSSRGGAFPTIQICSLVCWQHSEHLRVCLTKPKPATSHPECKASLGRKQIVFEIVDNLKRASVNFTFIAHLSEGGLFFILFDLIHSVWFD